MNVLDLDVYMDVLYIVFTNYAGFIILVVLVILFSAKKKAQANLRRLRMGRRRIAFVIYVSWVSRRRLSRLTYDGPLEPSIVSYKLLPLKRHKKYILNIQLVNNPTFCSCSKDFHQRFLF
jgi:hypothetical protein